ncbi:hypothetical protein Dvina_33700 [Dactylosporangium vinaceum]|uniref:Histidine kinase n=1 Tax=Dactylosporangium vinaceum TaxID=53362 RepID=A0ABV5MND1_9ACTN|nr:hypothetical protein [Dactylosporangium vinaceum]UAB93215.1 hypothetical protein Dvina_33700 [Dactylosporangium vinaceum]
MDFAAAIGASSAVLGTAVAVVGLVVNASNNRRAQYDRILAETAKLSQGTVADARHSAGLLLERRPEAAVIGDDTVLDKNLHDRLGSGDLADAEQPWGTAPLRRTPATRTGQGTV